MNMRSLNEKRNYLLRSIDNLNLPKEERDVLIERVNKSISSYEEKKLGTIHVINDKK